MKSKLKIVMLALIAHCVLCDSTKGQSYAGYYEYKRKEQEKLETKQRQIKTRKENIQVGLIIGGVLAIPLIIVSTTLIISKIKEKEL